jgi:hypothetical protein
MPNATRDGPVGSRYHHAHHAHHAHGAHGPYGHEHCPAHCRYCGPDAGAWDVGEIVVGVLVAVAAVVGWLARRPVVALLVAAAALLAWALA